ncbi:MAG: hypothetical protein OEQ18_10535, partial [Gammaproteobacteria bacterium]|nr:hypothetical protein [Gammaproteobacteria bacterium]
MKLVSALLCTALAVFSSIPTGTAATADTPAAAPTAGPQPGGGKNGDKLERLRTDAQALSASLRDLQRDIQQLDADLTKAGAAETSVLRKQRQGKYVELNDALELLVPAINKLIEAGGDAREFKAVAEASTKDLSKYLRAEIANAAELVSSLNEQVSAAPASETGKLMRRLPEARSAVDELLTMQFVNLKRMQALGMDGAADLKRLDELLIERAERLAGEMSVLVDQRKGVATEVAGATEDEKKSLKAEVSALTERIKLIARSLKSTTELLDERNIETAGYKRLLIAETGEITEDIFETQVFVGLLREWIELGRQWLVSDAPRWFFKLIVFLLILLVFMLLANLTRRVIRRGVATSRLHFSQLLQEFFVAFAGKAVLFIGILIALSQMGMQL